MLNQVLAGYNAPVRQNHRHFNVLNQRFVAIDVGDCNNCELVVKLRNIVHEIVSVNAMHFCRESWHVCLSDSQDAAVVLSLA